MTAADSSLLLADVVRALQGLYPPATAMDWDRVGLVTGDLSQPVSRVHLAVDPTLGVIEEAVAAGANLLVTHHPLLLRGVSSVATASAKGEAVTRAILGDLAIYCAHTNADVATPGVSDALAEACGLQSVEPLQGGPAPLGRIGTLPEPQTLQAFVERLAQALPATAGGIRVSGSPEEEVSRVAVVGGAGDDQFDAVRSAGADAYVTADLRHHPVLEEREQARGGRPFLVDAGHWASEWVWLASVERELTRVLDGAGQPGASTRLDTYISTLRTEPWTFVLGANAVGGTS